MTPTRPQDAHPDATQLFVANFRGVRYEDLPPEVTSITKARCSTSSVSRWVDPVKLGSAR